MRKAAWRAWRSICLGFAGATFVSNVGLSFVGDPWRRLAWAAVWAVIGVIWLGVDVEEGSVR